MASTTSPWPGPAWTRALQTFCRTMPGATEDVKWEDHLVFSVGQGAGGDPARKGKMFAVFDMNAARPDAGVSFKCDEDDFDRLCDADGIIPAPYMARSGWVKLVRSAALPASEAKALLRKSHGLVLATLPKRVQAAVLDGPG